MAVSNSKLLCCAILVTLNCIHIINGVESEGEKISASFIETIFKKYGTVDKKNNETVMGKDQFDNLLKSLSLGTVTVVCQANDTECLKDKYIEHNTTRKDPLLSRKRRGTHGGPAPTPSKNQTMKHQKDWNKHLDSCMSSQKISNLYKLKNVITKTSFKDICPVLIKQLDDKACVHFHKQYPIPEHPEGPPAPEKVWGFGFLAITICSLLSLAVIGMIPCLNKSFYKALMAYLVALAVGTLAGDAMLHLIPHTFIEGANLAAGVEVDKEQREAQHLSQVWRALFVLLGIYLFFLIEQFMKLKGSFCSTQKHGHHNHTHSVPIDDIASSEMTSEVAIVDHEKHEHHTDDESGHAHSHGTQKDITGNTKIASVAWMVIVGDGFHNFSDGLAVGAAFSASISSGIGTTIAIFCHELPHELGDFAILLKAGMTIKQAIVYNLVSAVLAYVGLALGIVAGTGELGRHIILSITAGLFLYISLVDMMGELTEHVTTVSSKCSTLICQHIGFLSGIGIMLVISIYEHDM